MTDNTTMDSTEAPGTLAETGTSGGQMTEAKVRRLIREEVSAAVAGALRPPAPGTPAPGELRSIYMPTVVQISMKQSKTEPFRQGVKIFLEKLVATSAQSLRSSAT